MPDCPISNQISIHCDAPEQLSASEILNKLLKGETVCFGGDAYELWEITDKIDVDYMRSAFQEDVEGDSRAVIHEYLRVILEMME